MRFLRHLLPWLPVAAILLLVLWAMQTPPTSVWSPAPGWSNGRVVATLAGTPTAPRAAPILVDAQGAVFLFTLVRAPGGIAPQVIAIRPDGARAWEHTFPIPTLEPGQLALRWDGPDLRLLWLDASQLYTAQIAPDGSGATEPQRISGAAEVHSYAVASSPAGELQLWYAGPPDKPGLYALPAGDLRGPAQLIDPAGTRPTIQIDQSGTLHAAWLASPPGQSDAAALWYTSLPPQPPLPAGAGDSPALPSPSGSGDGGEGNAPHKLADLSLTAGGEIEGPWLGVDAAHATLLWTVRVTQGRNAGSFYTQRVSLPLGAPDQVSAIEVINVPDSAALSSAAVGGALQAGPRVLLDPAAVGGAAPTACGFNSAGTREAAAACQAQIPHRSGDRVGQIGLLFFREGRPASYQLVSFGAGNAYAPSLTSDPQGHLYLSWLNLRSGGSDVYLATTEPALGRALDAPTWEDAGWTAYTIIFGMVQGVIFTPLTGLLWSVAPMLFIGVVAFIRRDRGEASMPVTALIIAAALGLFWFGKWRLLFQQAAAYVPFSAWLPDLPTWLDLPLRLGVPATIAGLSLWAAHRLTYGRQSPSIPFFTLITIGSDTLLTMAVYGGLFFGAFYPQG